MDRRFAIFDMDGTLVDSMRFWNRSSQEYLAGLGLPVPSDEFLSQTAHMTMPESAAFLVRELGLSHTAEEVAQAINALMEGHYRTDVPLKEGALTCLDKLREAGVPMCVASSTAPALIDACLRRLGVRDHFRFLLSSEEVGAGKDRPDVYLEAARRLGGQPQDTIVFEDALFAVRTAKGAGFPVAAVYDPSAAEDQEELRALADWYLLRLDDEGFLARF